MYSTVKQPPAVFLQCLQSEHVCQKYVCALDAEFWCGVIMQSIFFPESCFGDKYVQNMPASSSTQCSKCIYSCFWHQTASIGCAALFIYARVTFYYLQDHTEARAPLS